MSDTNTFLHFCLIQKDTSKFLVLPSLPNPFNYDIKDLVFYSCSDVPSCQIQIHFHPSRDIYGIPLGVISCSLSSKISVAILTNSPFLTYFSTRLQRISQFFLTQPGISKEIFIQGYNLLVSSVVPSPAPIEIETAFGVDQSLTRLLNKYSLEFPSLLKLLLIENKTIFLSTDDSSSLMMYALTNCMPGLITPFTDILSICGVDVINPLLELSLPFKNYSTNSLFFSLPLVSLNKIIGNQTGFMAAVCSSILRTRSENIDVIVDIDNSKLIWNNKQLQKTVSCTSSDKKFSKYLIDKIRQHKSLHTYEGSEHWLLMKSAIYIVQFLSTMCSFDIFSDNETQLKNIPKCQDYGIDFINGFCKTKGFFEWKKSLTLSGKAKKMTELFEPSHPCNNLYNESKQKLTRGTIYDYEQLFKMDVLIQKSEIQPRNMTTNEIDLELDDSIDL
ncbi:hypothetical protein EDI_336310 [Entamoeba dispar SAW760]|uniref:AVL9/DENND6 domain-containing protein n=1 Tax=Entamoeba dispar (strain ATCC PRA-260 / SAW760) TaxID=370354 RepID=B0ERT7_ENTDS|nr:uncharacterized protein EDI_336310 [Entamoeba dispar SAW760]EDR22732.1 hypothetical protein EDI_336310 [Entamoeba dispar SAW760]|eukprot:EDR22732.1 hypothetical protein EDI_336310 [Entamoeba dispar SAW760]